MADIPDRLREAFADRYPVERELGRGGMATVYLARDTKHGRPVALKILRPEYTRDIGPERFLREIEIAARLTHPNILPLHDSGEADGFLYYVMPYVQGETLRDRLSRERELSVAEAVRIARQVADALAHAHRQGIVHRDIKPENILLEDGQAVVADFGIARALSAAGGETLTATGDVIGTPFYMSPEQGSGEHEIDARSDLYALGCVLHEMLAGEPPFMGRTARSVIIKHMNETPPSVRAARPDVPAWLEDVVRTAMAKSAADRFQTAEGLSQALATETAPWPGLGRASGEGTGRGIIAGLFVAVRERRLLPIIGAYAVGGFVALEGVDQAVGHGLLPSVAYAVTLVFYLAGFAASAIVGWFHGRKGTQRIPTAEVWLLGGVAVAALAISGLAIRRDLQGSQGATNLAMEGGLSPKRVAVLYFEDLSSRKELGYLADGLTESLIGELAAVRDLDVVSSNGVAPYRASTIARDSIARALKAGTLIEGRVDDASGRLRVTVRLVDGVSGFDVERAGFELTEDRLLAARDSVVSEVSRLLRRWLGEEIRIHERLASTSSTEAWVLTQRGEHSLKRAEEHLAADEIDAMFGAFDGADSLFAQASALDSTWIVPLLGRGRVAYRLSRILDDTDEVEAEIAEGLGHVNRALQLAPNTPAALELRGTLRYWRWLLHLTADPTEHEALLQRAREDLERAVDLDPGLASAWSTLSHLYYQTEDLTSVVIAARRAYEEDAYLAIAPDVLWRLTSASYDLGSQFNAARRWCEEGARRFPDDFRFVLCQLMVMTTPAAAADVDRAWDLLAELAELAPEHRRELERLRGLMYVGAIAARAGLTDSATSILDRTRAEIEPEDDPGLELHVTEAFARNMAEDPNAAIDLLRAYAAAEHGFARGEDLHWWWRDLRDHPRFSEIETGVRE